MRIPANEVERQLALATEEAAAERLPVAQRAARVEELMEAHQAAERRQPFGTARVKGRKNGRYQEVITTGETVVGSSGLTYRRCLVPYTEAQELNRRRTRSTYFFRRGGKGRWSRVPPPRSSAKERDEERLEVRALMPYHCHDQMIAESRLERD